jgi:hypothetical protein
MSKLDVERLMRDLTIDQLQNIQENLSQQSHEKREELRKMVGRRYRDVLDASDTIRRLTEIATDLGNNMKEIRKISKNLLAGDDIKYPIKKETLFKFGLLLRLEDLLENPTDPLGDVFTFLFTENLHRGVSIESQSFKAENVDINLMLHPLGDRLITYRLALCDRLERHLGEQTDWEEVSGILAALAFFESIES